MKNLSLLLSIFLLSSLAAHAQNWAPLNRTGQYNYRLENSDNYISNVLWVDSVTVSGGDSVFHLNRVVIECDTCTLDGSDLGQAWYCDRLAKNQGQFLQKQVVKMPDGAYRFQGKYEFILHTTGKTGDSWTFSESDSIEATIVEESEEIVFSNLDSIKIIALSNGMQIWLSKQFGLLQFPAPDTSLHYQLVGIQGQSEGAQMPDYRSVYQYDEGDMLQYRTFSINSPCGNFGSPGTEKFLKLEILQKVVIDSFTLYLAVRDAYKQQLGTYERDTITLVIPHYSPIVNNPGSYLKFIWQNPFPDIKLDQMNKVKRIKVIKDAEGLVNIQSIEPPDCDYSISDLENTPDTGFIQVYPPLWYKSVYFTIKEKRGVTRYAWYQQSNNCIWQYSIDLTGYKIGLDSAGIIHPGSFYYPIIEEEPDSLQPGEELELLTFPNPVSGEFQLQLSHKSPEDLRLEIFNTTGQMVLRQNILKGEYAFPLDFSGFPRGYYVIRFKGKNTNIVRKILKL